jgi:hypothetical protein
MNNRPPSDDENEKQQSLSNSRPVRPELLKKIYYPDTLYPDGYTFFADRRSRPIDTNEPTGASNNPATLPKQSTIDIEMIERQSKYSVSVVCILKKANVIFDKLQCRSMHSYQMRP